MISACQDKLKTDWCRDLEARQLVFGYVLVRLPLKQYKLNLIVVAGHRGSAAQDEGPAVGCEGG